MNPTRPPQTFIYRWLLRLPLPGRRTLLLCGWLLAGWLPMQAAHAVVSCTTSSMTMYRSDGTTMLGTIFFPTSVGTTFFSGYMKWALSGCSNGANPYMDSHIISSELFGNPGITVTAQRAESLTPNNCQSSGELKVIFLSGASDCTAQFYFSLSTNASMSGTNIKNTTILTGKKISNNAPDDFWGLGSMYTNSGGTTRRSVKSTQDYTFSPRGCEMSSAAYSVDLGTWNLSRLNSDGSTPWVPITLQFNNCLLPDAVYSIQPTFSYTPVDSSNPNLIKSTGNAANVGVELATSGGTTIVSGTPYTLGQSQSGVTQYTYSIQARMKNASGTSASAGSVSAVVTINMNYP